MATFTNQASLLYNNTRVASNTVTGTITETLTAAKTAVTQAYTAGEPVTYVLSLVNSGTADLTGLTITDDLGTYTSGGLTLIPLDYVSGSATYYSDGALQPAPSVTAGDTLVIQGITVPAGGNAIVIYQAVPNEFAPPETGSTITNTAAVTGQGITSVTASETIPAASVPVLSINKALSPAEVTGNSPITYSFVIGNTGSAPEAAAVIEDTFDPVLSDITVSVEGVPRTTDEYTYDEVTGEFATVQGAFTVPAADFVQDPQTGAWSTVPGSVTVTVSGTV